VLHVWQTAAICSCPGQLLRCRRDGRRGWVLPTVLWRLAGLVGGRRRCSLSLAAVACHAACWTKQGWCPQHFEPGCFAQRGFRKPGAGSQRSNRSGGSGSGPSAGDSGEGGPPWR
jgi:hypothetical protein